MIKVTDDYYIDVDELNYTVCKPTNYVDKKSGKQRYKTFGYYGSIDGALMAIVNKAETESLKSDEEISLSEAITRIKEVHEKMRLAIKEAIPNTSAYRDRS